MPPVPVPQKAGAEFVAVPKGEHFVAAIRDGRQPRTDGSEGLAAAVPSGAGIIVAEMPAVTAMAIHEHLAALPGFLWADFDSEIDASAVIMPGAQISAQNVRIGAGSVIGPNAVILERTIIGAGCQIGATCVIGMEAFEQKPGATPKALLRQAGGVWIEDHVTLLPGCTVARSTFGGFNRIGAETKIDAQTYIAHDCLIGRRVTICACCDISGRVEIGDDAYLGPNCTISNGLRIGARATPADCSEQIEKAARAATGRIAPTTRSAGTSAM